MTREDTSSKTVSYKTRTSNLNCFLALILITTFTTAVYFVKKSEESLGDPSDQFVLKNIPRIYTKLESVDPEERDVFQGFRTSFLPAEEYEFEEGPYKEREVHKRDVRGHLDKRHGKHLARVKRKGHRTSTTKKIDRNRPHKNIDDHDDEVTEPVEESDTTKSEQHYDDDENTKRRDRPHENIDDQDDEVTESAEESDTTESEQHHDDDENTESRDRPHENIDDQDDEVTESAEESDTTESGQHYDDDENTESAQSQETHDDRGPLDDVVDQVRRQPELEEGEMGSSALVYKPSQSYSGIHAFWKGEGDKATIRHTQASIMRQYMDAGADPCHDFYQYACGNWAPVNPIPADKAGYDTFEILRENLDMVLKDLLKFKDYEDVVSVYPGPHLDIEETFTRSHATQKNNDIVNTIYQKNDTFYPDNFYSRELSNVNGKTSQVINRLRRYLDDKPLQFYIPANTIKPKAYHLKRKNKTFKKQTIKNEYRKKFKSLKHKSRSLSRNIKNIKVGNRLQMFAKSTRKRNVREVAHNTVKAELKILADLSDVDQQNDHKNDAAHKARFLFKSCMNYKILEKRGHQPLLDLLNQLGGWPILDNQWNNSDFDWLELMAKLRMYNNDILLSEWVGPDIKNSEEFIIQFDQTSLGLPTREYFLLDSNKMYLEAYEAYLIKIALLLGGDPIHVKTNAKQLIEFETKLAKITSAPEDRRNVSELYRRMTLAELEDLVPEVQWRRYLSLVMNRTVHSDETVVLFALNYVQHLVKLIEETEPNVLANYLLWRFVRHRVNNLDDRFQSAKQQFYYILFGREQAPSRWKNCVSQVNSNMGMALGSLFVRKYFDEISKNDTLHMTTELQQAFKELLHTIDWIDENTKSLAAQKVGSMMLRIGYPDFILDKKQLDERYKEVKIHPDKYFENILNILQHLTKVEQSRIGQPVNKTLWNTAPAVVNAYYSRNKNQIMFPAGILQPPFYHRHFPRSLNYGGIGVVIGHEITHGFDDKGRLFDCEGNLHRWWSDNSIAAFHKRAQCLINQYGQYVVPEVNMKLDGVNTQGENIADNGGVKQAFRAYTQWLQKHGDEGETMPGMNHTHKQLFFLNFAQVWCGAMRPEAMRNKLKTAVHSPGRFRVIGTLSNSEDFAREFNCPSGSQMNPVQKCTVW